MAESMKGLKRTCRCAEVTKADIGKKIENNTKDGEK